MEEKTYGIALVGAGSIAHVHAAAVRRIANARLVAVCDTSERACRMFSDAEGGIEWTDDLDRLLERDDIDIVNICTPSGTHAELAVKIAKAGKHLIVEKPLDITLERVDMIVAAAKENSIKLTGIFPYRFRRGVQVAKEAIQQGRLGRLVLADAYVKWHRPQRYYRGWHGTWALDGGGALMNQSIHNIDLLQWLAGPVESVFGHIATLGHDMEAEDTASAVLVFENGALGVIQGATSCWPGEPMRAEFHGTEGTIILKEGRITVWKLSDASCDEEKAMTALETQDEHPYDDPRAIGHTQHRLQIEDMLVAIEKDHEPQVSGAEARKAVEIIQAIYSSARQNKVMRFPHEYANP